MLPGPVFNLELLTTARRARYYVARSVFGLILLYVLWQSYESLLGYPGVAGGYVSPRQLAGFAQGTFTELAVVQGIAVLVLVPALFAGVIADEKQRRTLHYLLASRLTSGEIVLGKLAARMLHIGVALGVALPIFSLLTLLGGVPPALVVAVDVVTVSSALFLAGLSVLVSTYARKVREAVLVVFLIELSWLIGLPLARESLRWSGLRAWDWIGPALDWAYATSPVWTLFYSPIWSGPFPGSRASLSEVVGWTVALQLSLASLFILLAVARLRPVFRRQSGEAGPREGRRRLRWRLLPRPALGDSPMLWKELHVGRRSGLARWVVRVAALLGLILLGYWGLYFGEPALRELLANGYGVDQRRREDFNGYVRSAGTMLYVLWTLGLAAAASASITSEREEDTWISLLTTTLEPAEIVLAKMAGVVWGMRALGAVMVLLWMVGLLLGAVHPLGFVAVLVVGTAFSAFAVALGTYISLKARNTTRATVATVLILVLLNGGYMLCCIPMDPDTPLIAVGCTPFVMAVAPMSYDEFWHLLGAGQFHVHRAEEVVLTCILSVLGYGVAAGVLAAGAVARFDEAVDRPRRRWPWIPAAKAGQKPAPFGDDRDWD